MHAALAGGDHVLLLRAVAHVLEAGVGDRETLHRVDPRNTDPAEIRERFDRIAAGFEPARQDIGVLEGLAGALTGVRQHGMRRVADELDAAAAPILRQRPREQSPFRAFGYEAEELFEPRFRVRKAQAHLVGVAAGRPAFLDPLVGILLRDDVHELVAADVIGQQMTAGADPLDVSGRLQHLPRNIAAVQERAPDHLPRVAGIVVAVERLADDRAYSVGADYELGF